MTQRHERERINPNVNIEIMGCGEIGDKAGQLLEKKSVIEQSGFQTPHRLVLAQGFFDSFLMSNHLGNSVDDVDDPEGKIVNNVLNARFSGKDLSRVQTLLKGFGDKPLMIRSSAKGDATGTGIYITEIAENNPFSIENSLKRVLAGYFTESAKQFRKDTKSEEGFGVIIEPMIGQKIKNADPEKPDLFAPVLSGFGYTSTPEGEGCVSVIPGFGSGVDSRETEKIIEQAWVESGGDLSKYIERLKQEATDKRDPKTISDLLGSDIKMRSYDLESHEISTNSPDNNAWKNLMGSADLGELFNMMQTLDNKTDLPQYFEFAVTVENGKPTFWILQVADVRRKTEDKVKLPEIEKLGEPLLTGHEVRGTGVKEAKKAVFCRDYNDLRALRRFNEENNDYVLIYKSDLLNLGNLEENPDLLKYSDMSNAGVVLEYQENEGNRKAVEHFGGQMAATEKFFAVLDTTEENPPPLDKFGEKTQKEEGLPVFEGTFKIVADQRTNKMEIYIEENRAIDVSTEAKNPKKTTSHKKDNIILFPSTHKEEDGDEETEEEAESVAQAA